jgi:uncharacterized membrane protein
MIFAIKTRILLFKIIACLFFLAAIYHSIGIFCQVDQSPPWRHSIFVVINLFGVYGFLKRPNYFIYFVALLFIQQCYSHGTYMVNLWIQTKQIHWISVIDLIVLPIGLVCLFEEGKWKKD